MPPTVCARGARKTVRPLSVVRRRGPTRSARRIWRCSASSRRRARAGKRPTPRLPGRPRRSVGRRTITSTIGVFRMSPPVSASRDTRRLARLAPNSGRLRRTGTMRNLARRSRRPRRRRGRNRTSTPSRRLSTRLSARWGPLPPRPATTATTTPHRRRQRSRSLSSRAQSPRQSLTPRSTTTTNRLPVWTLPRSLSRRAGRPRSTPPPSCRFVRSSSPPVDSTLPRQLGRKPHRRVTIRRRHQTVNRRAARSLPRSTRSSVSSHRPLTGWPGRRRLARRPGRLR